MELPLFVCIVESPSSDDLLDGRTEGAVLRETLKLADAPVSYNLVTTRQTFDLALGARLLEALKQNPGCVPAVHFSGHGDAAGIQLTDGTRIAWDDLGELLRPINEAMVGFLIVCMSSCHGFAGCQMAMTRADGLPFFAIVGHSDQLSWRDGAVAYAAFYHRLRKGAGLVDAVAAMKAASGDDRFFCDLGQRLHDCWVIEEPRLVREAIIRALSA